MTKYGLRNNNARFNQVKTDKIVISDKVPVCYTIGKAAAVATGDIISSKDFNALGSAAQTRGILLIQPAFPCAIAVTNNTVGSADDADSIIFVGKAADGSAITDTVTIGSAANATSNTSNAYAEITSITANKTIKCTSLAFGHSSTLGLPWPLVSTSDVITYNYNGAFGTSDKVNNLTNLSTTYNTIGVNALGTNPFTIIYKTKIQNEDNLQVKG